MRKDYDRMADLQTAVEDYLAALPEGEWRCLVARVRPPDEPTAQQPQEVVR